MPLAGDLVAQYPWLADMGIPESTLEIWLVEYANDPYGLVAAIRNTPQHKSRFPAFRNEDGSLRDGMTEQEYISRETRYRQIMSYYGDATYRYDKPSDFEFFFTTNITAEELESRFQLYEALDVGTEDLRQAMYVYGGMDVTTDTLYTAVVNGSQGDPIQLWHRLGAAAIGEAIGNSDLMAEYEARVTTNPPDYNTWADRMVTWNLQTADALIAADPTLTDNATLPSPETARAALDRMYAAASAGVKKYSIVDLEQAYRLALVGSAASAYSFDLPDEPTVTRWLEKGVERANALQAYGQVSVQGAAIQASLQRAGLQTFRDVTQMTEALLQGQGSVQINTQLSTRIALAEATSKAATAETGAASTDITKAGTLAQPGLRQTGIQGAGR